MKKYQCGGSNEYAELLIDYSNKKAKILDPDTHKKMKDSNFNFSFGLYSSVIIIVFIILSGYFFYYGEYIYFLFFIEMILIVDRINKCKEVANIPLTLNNRIL